MNKNFLEKLQTSDERTKRRWVFGGSFVFMIVLAYIWLMYFNSLTSNIASPAAPVSGNQFTFFDTMKNGAATIYNFFMGKLGAFSQILKTPREYIVNPK